MPLRDEILKLDVSPDFNKKQYARLLPENTIQQLFLQHKSLQ